MLAIHILTIVAFVGGFIAICRTPLTKEDLENVKVKS